MDLSECPTCGNGMAVVRAGVGWCRRCGTVKFLLHGESKEVLTEVPKLVERCRELASAAFQTKWQDVPAILELQAAINRLNIPECIHPPGGRT